MPGSLIVAGARTPIGRFNGGLAGFAGAQLGAHAISHALQRAGVSGEQVDHVIMGQVLQAGQGQITARQAAVGAGIPMNVPAITINKVCLSGLNAIYLADQMISSGDADIVVAGGMESMTNAPYVLPSGRNGLQMGHGELQDAMIHDGLWCAFDDGHMGDGTERDAANASIDRSAMDEFSARSHERAAAAQKDGKLEAEIAAVEIPQRGGDPLIIDSDEGVRPGTSAESLANLRPAFAADGAVTAGNASQISDGGCAVVMVSPAKAEELGLDFSARVVSYGMVSGPDTSLLTQPSRAIQQALSKVDLKVTDLGLFELNEAFAAVGLAATDDLGVSDEIVNVNGGAVALGHPIGMSGNRLALTLINELGRRGGGFGAAALCGGGGQGDALILEVA
ncbi:MAG TPA: acetyl-CoA C-acyltransferase [Acidimicrobiaceae bacterium]|nr:acetyl-CoA C-acetyltransferase [Actinomycetota bacterium]HAE55069.1 acetyl-CoA C-acyltransferase [Acidimicrobiaceae bacterium]HAQ43651.1 acetyl-CoA C-acyltransferase [Acidimicrobiaceae bacterium]HBU40486.1 acetyl-CoA C-acyltransferase [Acidimicrobiaceae bacterium]|tara:strand:- start:2895 stop:4076 length:1182 start_codon:yes stop_codon:yes gene_type:complete